MTLSAGYRVVPDSTDAVVEAWGPERASCLEQAALGLVSLFAATDGVAPAGERIVAIDPDPDERELLVAVLEEVIFLAEVRNLVPVRIHLADTPSGGVAGSVEVVPLDQVETVGPRPKGVGWSGLVLEQTRERWRCRALIDR